MLRSKELSFSLVISWLILCFLNGSIHADEDITIFDVRKNLAMSDQDLVYRDFYLSKGRGSGLKPGMILTVRRKIPLYDSFHNRHAGNLSVPVSRIKIIYVESDLAVARLHSDFHREELPVLEDNFIMSGDFVDLKSATTESKLKGTQAEVEKENLKEDLKPPSQETSLHDDHVEKKPSLPQSQQADLASQSPTVKAPSVEGPRLR